MSRVHNPGGPELCAVTLVMHLQGEWIQVESPTVTVTDVVCQAMAIGGS